MQVIVITGSTRGIGYGLAHEFLKRGCAVVINGRSQESVDKAVVTLTEKHDASRILGYPCDVSDYEQLQGLWDAAVAKFSKVDYWVNNAGIDNQDTLFWNTPHTEYERIVQVNLLAVMHASHVAFKGMNTQGHGQIFNMEGFGSAGRKRNGYTSYGTTKYALRYFTQSLAQEAEDTPVFVGTISPGMVVTELLMGGYSSDEAREKAKKIFNILADKVETVTPFLVEQMLANAKNDAAIAWLTTPKIIWRFMTSAFNKRDLFAEE